MLRRERERERPLKARMDAWLSLLPLALGTCLIPRPHHAYSLFIYHLHAAHSNPSPKVTDGQEKGSKAALHRREHGQPHTARRAAAPHTHVHMKETNNRAGPTGAWDRAHRTYCRARPDSRGAQSTKQEPEKGAASISVCLCLPVFPPKEESRPQRSRRFILRYAKNS